MTDNKSQIDKFKQAARDLGCDDDDNRFKERLAKLAGRKVAKEETRDG